MANHGCNLKHHSERRFCCAGCKRPFSSMAAFDRHRTGTGSRTCLNPGTVLRDGEPVFSPLRVSGKHGIVVVWRLAANDERWSDESTDE